MDVLEDVTTASTLGSEISGFHSNIKHQSSGMSSFLRYVPSTSTTINNISKQTPSTTLTSIPEEVFVNKEEPEKKKRGPNKKKESKKTPLAASNIPDGSFDNKKEHNKNKKSINKPAVATNNKKNQVKKIGGPYK